ncbi:MAG: flavoprotein [Candidatus Omnitrophica bacterium]|nr:flavoprotein [Candidatus Omnitrophota bacterium]
MKHVIIGITGSIAAYKACDLITLYRKNGLEVTCIMTEEARHFITPLTLETLTGNKVAEDMFALPENRSPQHIALAEKTDLVVIYPASANVIGKLAHGLCDDLLTCVIFATHAPVLIAPAMNANMFTHAVVQQNIAALKKIGYIFIGPIKGRLASGRHGIGHVAEVPDLWRASQRVLS